MRLFPRRPWFRLVSVDDQFQYPDDPWRCYRIARQKEHDIGVLRLQVCEQCGVGLLCDLSLDPDWHRRGIGRRCVRWMVRRWPDMQWRTSGQFEDAAGFWRKMSAETGRELTESRSGLCPHLG